LGKYIIPFRDFFSNWKSVCSLLEVSLQLVFAFQLLVPRSNNLINKKRKEKKRKEKKRKEKKREKEKRKEPWRQRKKKILKD